MTGIPIPIARMAFTLAFLQKRKQQRGLHQQLNFEPDPIVLFLLIRVFWEVGERESQFIPKKRRFSKNSSLVGRHCIFYHGELRCNGLPATRRGPSR